MVGAREIYNNRPAVNIVDGDVDITTVGTCTLGDATVKVIDALDGYVAERPRDRRSPREITKLHQEEALIVIRRDARRPRAQVEVGLLRIPLPEPPRGPALDAHARPDFTPGIPTLESPYYPEFGREERANEGGRDGALPVRPHGVARGSLGLRLEIGRARDRLRLFQHAQPIP